MLHAGGKFGGGSYKVSGGLHGVGVSVVNALSERLVIEVDKDGFALPAGVRQGRQAAGQAGAGRPTPPRGRTSGTTVAFWPDPTVFSSEGTEFHARTVLERLQTMAFLNKGLEIQFIDERPDKEQKVSYVYKGGIVDFVKHLNASKEALFSRVAASAPPRTTRRSTSPCSGTRATTRASTATPTASPPPRAACTWRASRPR